MERDFLLIDNYLIFFQKPHLADVYHRQTNT